MAVVVRSYHGDSVMLQRLLDNLRMFVLPQVERVVVLDDESKEDHVMGDMLIKKFNVTVFYEKLPAFDLVPSAQGMARGKTLGYQRQMWSSFYLDRYTKADVIAQLDSDAQIFSLLTPDVLFDEDGKIQIRATPGDHWRGDEFAKAQKWNYFPNIDAMWLDRMPMFFWRKTFPKFRAFEKIAWKKSTFDESFQIWSGGQYSWQNVLFQFGAVYHKHLYRIRLSTEYPPVASIGTNKPQGLGAIRAGCCRSFRLDHKSCTERVLQDYRHLVEYNNVRPVWLANASAEVEAAGFADAHYERVRAHIRQGRFAEEFRVMRGLCEAYLDAPPDDWRPRTDSFHRVRDAGEPDGAAMPLEAAVEEYLARAGGDPEAALAALEDLVRDAEELDEAASMEAAVEEYFARTREDPEAALAELKAAIDRELA